MKTKIQPCLFACVLAIGTAMLPSTTQAFGLPNLGGLVGGLTGGASGAGDVGSLVESTFAASALVTQSLVHMNIALTHSKESAAYNAALKEAQAIQDPKERAAKLEKVQADAETMLQKELAKDNIKQKVSGLDQKSKKALGSAFFNYALGVLKTAQAVQQATNLVQSVGANPMNAMQLLPLTAAITPAKNIMTGSATILSKVPELFGGTNIKIVKPTSVNQKPEPVNL